MRLLIFFVLMIPRFLATAQEFTVHHLKDDEEFIPPLVLNGNYYYGVDSKRDEVPGLPAGIKQFAHSITIYKYDKDLRPVKSQEMADGNREFGPLEPVMIDTEGQLSLLFFRVENDNIKLYHAFVNTETLVPQNPRPLLAIKLDEEKMLLHLGSPELGDLNRSIIRDTDTLNGNAYTKTFFVETSDDGEKFLVAWNSGFDNKLFYTVFSRQWNIHRTGSLELDPENLRLTGAVLDNNGTIYLAATHGPVNDHSAVVYISRNRNEVTRHLIRLENARAFGITAWRDDDEVCLAGTYKQGGRGLAGVYLQKISTKDQKTDPVVITAFPDELIMASAREGNGFNAGADKGISDNLFINVHELTDGSFRLVAEFKSENEREGTMMFNAGSLIVIQFKKGVALFTWIPRNLLQRNALFNPGYYIFLNREDVVLVYPDLAKNINREIELEAYRSELDEPQVLAGALIRPDGTVQRKVILDNTRKGYRWQAEKMMRISEKTFLTRSYLDDSKKNHYWWKLLSID